MIVTKVQLKVVFIKQFPLGTTLGLCPILTFCPPATGSPLASPCSFPGTRESFHRASHLGWTGSCAVTSFFFYILPVLRLTPGLQFPTNFYTRTVHPRSVGAIVNSLPASLRKPVGKRFNTRCALRTFENAPEIA